VYSTCLFCNQVLGSNQLIEAFPVGRRLAFDQRRGRLWVVCRKCEKWNLTPLEERWEAIETCERLFRDTRKRASTDNIGLARLPEGLELVRIGEPERPEFAAWRYGDQFGRRRKRGILLGVAWLDRTDPITPMSAHGSWERGVDHGWHVINLGLQVSQAGGMAYRKRKVLAGIPSTEGKKWLVRRAYVAGIRLVPSVSGDGWGLEIPCEEDGVKRRITLEGGDARRLAAKLVPTLTPDGGHRENVRSAVRKIEDQGDAEQYLNWLARNLFKWRDWSRRRDIVPATGHP
jgi:hypothetical protein